MWIYSDLQYEYCLFLEKQGHFFLSVSDFA